MKRYRFRVEFIPIAMMLTAGVDMYSETFEAEDIRSLRRPDFVTGHDGRDYIRCLWIEEVP